jgi:hypothetical protein
MKKIATQLALLLVLAAGFSACKKDYGNHLGPLQDSIAAIPVTVTNQVYFERFPVVTTTVDTTSGLAKSNGKFSIILSIPADRGKIKEITKVATGNSGVEYLQNPLYPNYLDGPLAGNGTNTITFSSDLNAVRNYVAKLNTTFARPDLPAGFTKTTAFAFTESVTRRKGTLTPNTNPQTPNQLRYFFLITLEDGTQLISTEVDVRLIF